jgi:hypothetical protein
MNRLSGLGQPRGLFPSRGPVPSRQPPTGRRAMTTGTGIFLVTVGAILVFALSGGSPRWLNLHIVGVILILSGTFGMLLPWLARVQGDRFRRWVVPLLSRPGNEPPLGADSAVYGDGPALARDSSVNGDRPTLADDLLNFEHDPPL